MSKYYVVKASCNIDESVNIGIIAVDSYSIKSRFLKDWSRANAFIGFDVEEVSRSWRESVIGVIESGEEPILTTQTSNWIACTPARGSVLSADKLIEDVFNTFCCDGDMQESYDK